jgi:sugar lactone lactonase YvrE
LAVDETGSLVVDQCRVYWTKQEGEIGGEVFAMSHVGGETERLATNLTFAHALALSSERLFFADARGVHVTPLDASAAAMLVLPYMHYPIDVAADDTWVFVASPDGLMRAPVDGSEDEEWVLSTPASLLALDEGTIYLRTTDALVGVDAETFDAITLVSLAGEVWDMVVGEDAIYLARGDRITRVAKSGGTEETLVSGGTKISALAVDDTQVFWTDSGTGSISAADLDGGEVVPLAVEVSPIGIAIDEHSVFWTTTQPGRVSRRAKPDR